MSIRIRFALLILVAVALAGGYAVAQTGDRHTSVIVDIEGR